MVTLRHWREQQGLSRSEVATSLRTDKTTVFRWELPRGHSDKRIPTQGFMDQIHRLTRGEVTPNDFYDLAPLDQLNLPIDDASAPLLDCLESAQ